MSLLDGATLTLVLLFAVLISAALAPLETLGWWAGWFGPDEAKSAELEPPPTPSKAKQFVVFLAGIHTVSEETYARREQGLLESLRQRLPDAAIVEIFPYSVNNRALTGQRFFSWFWRLVLNLKLSRFGVAGIIINLRNIFQVAVSADRRYGPLYNQGTAETIFEALRQHGYAPGSGVPVSLIGYSGGGQIAAGTASYLKPMLDAPLTIISLGGIMASEDGMLVLDGLYHLVGSRDRVHKLGYLFPGRWKFLPYSAWNLALAKGIAKIIPMGPVDHTGRDGYLDINFTLPDGRTSMQQTVDVISAIVSGEDVAQFGHQTSVAKIQ